MRVQGTRIQASTLDANCCTPKQLLRFYSNSYMEKKYFDTDGSDGLLGTEAVMVMLGKMVGKDKSCSRLDARSWILARRTAHHRGSERSPSSMSELNGCNFLNS